jgi:hypothetical protein
VGAVVLLHATIGGLAGLAAAVPASALPSSALWLGVRVVAVLLVSLTVLAGAAIIAVLRAGHRPSSAQWWVCSGPLLSATVVLTLGAYWGLYAWRW